MNFERRFSRRAFLKAGTLLAGGSTLAACAPHEPPPDRAPGPRPTPVLRIPNNPSDAKRDVVQPSKPPTARAVIERPKTAFQQIWTELPAVERVRMIEKRQIPESEPVNRRQELIRASAELYCENAPVTCSGRERSQQVHVLPTQKFIEEIEKYDGPITSSQERKKLEEAVLEHVIQKPPLVLINQGAFDRQVGNSLMFSEQLRIINEKGISIPWSFLKHVLLHAFAHLDQTDEVYTTPQVHVNLPRSQDYLIVNRLEGFKIIGTYRGITRSFNGGNEALTEHAVDKISRMTVGFDISGPTHQLGLALLSAINKTAGISERMAKDMYYNKRSVKDLINAWGSIVHGSGSTEEKGIELYTIFSLTAGGIIPPDIGKAELEKRIGQKL